MNIKKTPIERLDVPQKIAKLAIEAEREQDRFETATYVKDLEYPGEKISSDSMKSVVDGILDATSYAKKEEIQAWELEINPCEHILALEQKSASEIGPDQLKKCSSCDLEENLWLCLVCGNLGCGRAQFGGVGGNSHGLAHFEQTGHGVSVKLGSITPEGTADVFCYIHGDEIQDPNLKDHMAHWGINIADSKKTEKSLTEMQLEQNLKWDFSMTTEDGKSLEPIYGPGLTGMKNLGNSCYMSSVLQCLFDIPEIQAIYGHTEFPMVADPANDLYVQLVKLADGLLSGRYSVPDDTTSDEIKYQRGIAPGMLKALIGRGHPEFSSMRQQDSFEFLGYLLSKMSAYSKSHGLVDSSDIFKFNTERRIECSNCHKVRYHVDNQENLSVPVPIRELEEGVYEPVELQELFDRFTEKDLIEYTCSACKKTSESYATVKFQSLPDILVLNARRFSIKNWVPVKLDIPVSVGEDEFLLDQYLSVHAEGEDILEDDEDVPGAFVANETALQQLEAMGFPPNRGEKALHATGNDSAEAAMEWLFQHLEDPDIDAPIDNKAATSTGYSQESIEQLMDMGFTPGQARRALKETGGNVERSVEWLFSNPDAAEEPENVPATPKEAKIFGSIKTPAKYRLKSIICHKGGSIHAGHYVAFVRKIVNGSLKWVLFNDEKVVLGGEAEEMKKFAYIYFFERIPN